MLWALAGITLVIVLAVAIWQRGVVAKAKEAHEHTALTAGTGRLRPVLMTALAMVIGMLPMSLGLGEGGEQNAPLGRAVIGGLFLATVATLFFVPVVFSLVHRQQPKPAISPQDHSAPQPDAISA